MSVLVPGRIVPRCQCQYQRLVPSYPDVSTSAWSHRTRCQYQRLAVTYPDYIFGRFGRGKSLAYALVEVGEGEEAREEGPEGEEEEGA
eukprot:1164829-Rhodomonas_salina.1